MFASMRSDEQPIPIVPQNAATAPAKNKLSRHSLWETPPNCQYFHDNLYQAQLSGCSARISTENLCPTITNHSKPLPL